MIPWRLGTQKKRAPLLFRAELQAECSKRFKISPDETLQVAQDLYEKKLTTYPRTDARVLSSAVAKEITKNISGLNFAPVAPYVERIMKEGRYRNNLGTRSIRMIPRLPITTRSFRPDELTELESLNSLQKASMRLVIARFLLLIRRRSIRR